MCHETFQNLTVRVPEHRTTLFEEKHCCASQAFKISALKLPVPLHRSFVRHLFFVRCKNNMEVCDDLNCPPVGCPVCDCGHILNSCCLLLNAQCLFTSRKCCLCAQPPRARYGLNYVDHLIRQSVLRACQWWFVVIKLNTAPNAVHSAASVGH